MLRFFARRRFNLTHLIISIIVFQYISVGLYAEAAVTYIVGIIICTVMDRTASKDFAVVVDNHKERIEP